MNKVLKKKKQTVIFDIDGTVSDPRHRLHYIEKSPKDWKSFHNEALDDPPNEWCVNLVHACLKYGYSLVFCTGRNEEHRNDTIFWLDKYLNLDSDEYKLFMRAKNDYREDQVVKKEIYHNYLRDAYDIVFIVEDRRRVVDMWRKEGLVVLHCAEGNF